MEGDIRFEIYLSQFDVASWKATMFVFNNSHIHLSNQMDFFIGFVRLTSVGSEVKCNLMSTLLVFPMEAKKGTFLLMSFKLEEYNTTILNISTRNVLYL